MLELLINLKKNSMRLYPFMVSHRNITKFTTIQVASQRTLNYQKRTIRLNISLINLRARAHTIETLIHSSSSESQRPLMKRKRKRLMKSKTPSRTMWGSNKELEEKRKSKNCNTKLRIKKIDLDSKMLLEPTRRWGKRLKRPTSRRT